KNAAELAKARRKVRDADSAALAIGKNGRYDGGVAKIFRLEIGKIVEHDVGESLLLIAGKEAGEDGIAVESRVTPPHQPCRGIHERGRAPVADDGKIKPIIGHGVANASLREICSSQRRTSGGSSTQAAMPGTSRPPEMPMPSKSGRTSNTPRSVTSSPMKMGRRSENGGEGNNFPTAGALSPPARFFFWPSFPPQSPLRPPLPPPPHPSPPPPP